MMPIMWSTLYTTTHKKWCDFSYISHSLMMYSFSFPRLKVLQVHIVLQPTKRIIWTYDVKFCELVDNVHPIFSSHRFKCKIKLDNVVRNIYYHDCS